MDDALKDVLLSYVVADLEMAIDQVEDFLVQQMLEEGVEADDMTDEQWNECRELAESVVVTAWLNRDNPLWDPLDPSTHQPAEHDPLRELLVGYGG